MLKQIIRKNYSLLLVILVALLLMALVYGVFAYRIHCMEKERESLPAATERR